MIDSHPPLQNVRIPFDVPATLHWVEGTVEVLDEHENVIHSHTMTEGDLSNLEYSFIVDAQYNDIGTETKGLRTVTLKVKDAEGIAYDEDHRYYLLAERRLVMGENSILNFTQALLMVPDLTELNGWYDAADDNARKAALREAYELLSEFNLNESFVYNSIAKYSKEELEALDERVLNNFRRAQMLHADYLLGGDPEKMMREKGVISNSAGESTMFLRTTKQINYGISDRAYRYISKYLATTTRLVNA